MDRGGGYIWRAVDNFYLEPWVAFHVVSNAPEIRLADQTFHPRSVMAEASIKIGWFFDL